MTATRTKVDDLGTVDLTPLPAVTDVVAVGIVHRSRQHRAALAELVGAADDLELLVEANAGTEPLAELARTMPDVAVVDLDAVGVDGIDALARQLPAIALVVVAEDDGPALGDALLAGATSVATTAGGTAAVGALLRDAFARRASLTRGAAARVVEVVEATGADLPADELGLLQDLAAGRTVADCAEARGDARSAVAASLAAAVVRVGPAARS